jgi:hypothetical protein
MTAPRPQGRDMISMQVTPAPAHTDSKMAGNYFNSACPPSNAHLCRIWHGIMRHSPEPYSLLQDINGWPTSPGRSDDFSVGSRQGSLISIGESGGGWGGAELSGILNAQVTRHTPLPSPRYICVAGAIRIGRVRTVLAQRCQGDE